MTMTVLLKEDETMSLQNYLLPKYQEVYTSLSVCLNESLASLQRIDTLLKEKNINSE